MEIRPFCHCNVIFSSSIVCFIASAIGQKTKCQIPNFFVLIFDDISVRNKKRPGQAVSSNFNRKTNKSGTLHLVFSHQLMQWNKIINLTLLHSLIILRSKWYLLQYLNLVKYLGINKIHYYFRNLRMAKTLIALGCWYQMKCQTQQVETQLSSVMN